MNYYCLMAGAPELSLRQSKVPISVAEFRQECQQELSPKDMALLEDYFFLEQDCINLCKILENEHEELQQQGNHSVQQLCELIQEAREIDQPVSGYHFLLAEIVRTWDTCHLKEGYFAQDQALFTFLKYVVEKCPNALMRQWSQMRININNILTALLCKRHGWDVANYIVGNDLIQETICQNAKEKDFKLTAELEYMPYLEEIAQQEDPVEKERMMDTLSWTWLEEASSCTPFSIEGVFAYLCRLNILERWSRLDVEQGKQCFEQIIDNLRGEARVPAEFKR